MSYAGNQAAPKPREITGCRELDGLKPVTTPILLNLLEGEVRFPRLFLLKCRLTVGGFKKTIDKRFPEELVDLAALPLWVYIHLKRRIGQHRAFEIMRIAILTSGVVKWNSQFHTVDKERSFPNFCDQEIEVNKTGVTKWNTLEVVERSERRFEIKITRCLYHELTTAVGIPELTPIVCQVDNAVFNSYLPDQLVFDRGGAGRRISDGAKECNFVWTLRE